MTSRVKKPIQRSKTILSSTPVFRGTRVPIQNLLDYIMAGDTIDDFLSDFPSVKHTQVEQVLRLIGKKIPTLVA